MIDSVGAIETKTSSVGFPSDVKVNERSGGSVAKAEETASKPSLTVTDGAQNTAAAVVEKTRPHNVRREDLIRHDDSTLIPGDVLRAQNNTPATV